MKILHSIPVAIAFALAISTANPAAAKPGLCPTPAKMPTCAKGWRPVCLLPITCKTPTGKLLRICRKWTCMHIVHY